MPSCPHFLSVVSESLSLLELASTSRFSDNFVSCFWLHSLVICVHAFGDSLQVMENLAYNVQLNSLPEEPSAMEDALEGAETEAQVRMVHNRAKVGQSARVVSVVDMSSLSSH